MGIYGQLPDVPWHIGSPKMDENDKRRHKARCIYYNHETKKCRKIDAESWMLRCGGSSHCRFYTEDSDKAYRITPTDHLLFEEDRDDGELGVRAQTDDLMTVRELESGKCLTCSIRGRNSGRKEKKIASWCLNQAPGFEFRMDGIQYRLIEIRRGNLRFSCEEEK